MTDRTAAGNAERQRAEFSGSTTDTETEDQGVRIDNGGLKPRVLIED